MSTDIEDITVLQKPDLTKQFYVEFFTLFYAEFVKLQETKSSNEIDATVIRRIISRIYKEFKSSAKNNSRAIKVENSIISNEMLRSLYKTHIGVGSNPLFENLFKINSTRSNSGVLTVSLMLDGRELVSCEYNCHYCPNEPGMARSYLSNEGVPMLGVAENFSMIYQVLRRLVILKNQGHIIDKMEVLFLGGTWHSFPKEYRDKVVLEMYYACNYYAEFFEGQDFLHQEIIQKFAENVYRHKMFELLPYDELIARRPIMSLEKEKEINKNNSSSRVISLVLESRPDQFLTRESLLELRIAGCTRVQMGVQSLVDRVLKVVNRGHNSEHTRRAIRMLLNSGFKIDLHFMPDLPGSTYEDDLYSIMETYTNPDFRGDQYKWYTTMDVMFTKIREWKLRAAEMIAAGRGNEVSQIEWKMQNGGNVPDSQKVWRPRSEYDYETLCKTLTNAIMLAPTEVRNNRISRDFQEASEKNGRLGYETDNLKTNIREKLEKEYPARDIRAREVFGARPDNYKETARVIVKDYPAAGGVEYFISLECARPEPIGNKSSTLLLGLIRLRIMYENGPFSPCDKERLFIPHAFIRELHVYGALIGNETQANRGEVQHSGIGKFLMKKAEFIAQSAHNVELIYVISGVGVMRYYEKLGYTPTPIEEGEYMKKSLKNIHIDDPIWMTEYNKK